MPYDVNSSYTYYDPYSNRYRTETSTVTLYGNPSGWILDGIGFFMFFGGLMLHVNDPQQPQATTRQFQGKVCGNCFFFGKEECKKQEKIFNAMPCEDFTP